MNMAERVRIAEARANQHEINEKKIEELEKQLTCERERRFLEKKEFEEIEASMDSSYRDQIQCLHDEIFKMEYELRLFHEKESSNAIEQAKN
ncbi:hypothetical protein HMI55_002572 [Coelomomyces lativittatus]|nr:hypothetical protein HMI55_002572 [Coelomomyces lativittatus]